MKITLLQARSDGQIDLTPATTGNGRANTAIAAIAGGLHALAFEAEPLWWLQLLALALLVWRAGRAPGAWAAARLSFVFGLGWFGVGVNWVFISMHHYGGMHPALAGAATALFCGYLALFPALATGVWGALMGRGAARGGFAAVLVFAALWGASEWLRGTLFTGFPWIASGLAHVDGPLAGWMPLVGQTTVNAIAGFVAAALVSLLEGADARLGRGGLGRLGRRGGPAGALGGFGQGGPGASARGAAGFAGAWKGGRMRVGDSEVIDVGGPGDGAGGFGGAGGGGAGGPFGSGAGGGARHAIAPLLAFALLGGGAVLGGHAWTAPHGEPMRVRLLQGNVPQDMKFQPEQLAAQLATYARLAGVEQVRVGPPPQLIVMPETAIPVLMPELPTDWTEAIQGLAARDDLTVLTGVPLAELTSPDARRISYFNSVIALDGQTRWQLNPSRGGQRYDKHHLVPFSEFIPFGFKWFVDAMVMPLDDFTRGALAQPPIVVRDQRIGPNVCYEDLFGDEIAARFNQPGQPDATVLLNVSNLAWFDDSAALPQHLLASRARSLETGRPMLRATNTGMTAIVGPDGRVQAALPPLKEGVLDGTVQGMTGLTPYARHGDLALLGVVALGVIAVRVRRRAG
ncbi:apolipoprotein N-acyltransferase [Derxia gummosa]|uniref:Apolipoprotein N-acyltransferase n=1 Tax=Derxia gummosa DSM 723 TaxID=1121388 RepID=A0A8B6XAC5_9BURK|nr:apolipoprotein N-acyltransferase [Derxia gummosa]